MTVAGEQPSAEDELWLSTASELNPAKSLQRIEDKVGFIFRNVALFGTVLGGLGVTSAVAASGRVEPKWVVLLLILIFLSVALALAANLPSTRSEINPVDVIAVRQFFEGRIKRNGWLARISLAVFSVALIVACLVLLSGLDSSPRPAVSLRWTRDGGGASVHAAVKADRVPEDMMAETTVFAALDGEKEILLFHDISAPGRDGKVEVKADIKSAVGYRAVRLVTLLRQGERVVEAQRSLVLDVPS